VLPQDFSIEKNFKGVNKDMPAAKKKIKKAKPKAKKKVDKKPKKKTAPKIKKILKKSVKKSKRPAKPGAKRKAKKAVKKPAPALAPTWHLPREGEVLVGVVEDYLSHLEVILTTLKAPLTVGDMVSVGGFTTNLEQIVRCIQIEPAPVNQAAVGQAIGFKVDEKVRKNDHIFKKA
jgi:hypothetical protein